MKASKIILILFLFFQAAHSFAQLQLDEDEWRKQRDDHKYGVEQKDETKEKAIDKVGNQFNINSTAEAIKLVFFIIIIAALLFLIYKFILDNQRINSGDEGLVFVEDLKAAEENLMRADLQKLLDKFISEKDYRSAIRTQYLQVIQTLNKQKRIKWAKDKTNLDYYMELR